MRGDRGEEIAYIALNLETAIMATASIELVAGEDTSMAVVLSAGATADPLFRLLVANLNPSREVYFIADVGGNAVTETASDGGLLLALEHECGGPPHRMGVSGLGYQVRKVDPERCLVNSLLSYREEFEKRAGVR
jgi:hypothetical protein